MNGFRLLLIGAILMIVTVFAMTTLSGSYINTGNAAGISHDEGTYQERHGWELIWSDEFDGDVLDPEKWAAETSCWGGGNNERQCYTAREDNVAVHDGVLKLKAKAEMFTGLKYPQDWEQRGELVTQNYTSGKVRTKGLHHWTYGRFEARIKLPHGQGTWPAFWMLPEENHYGKWPLSGEIDIMESINLGAACDDCGVSDIENRSSVALHFGHLWPENQFRSHKNSLPNGIDGYHIFAAEWHEDRIHWFVDNQKIFTLTKDQWFTQAVTKQDNQFAPFDRPFYLMLNLAVGGNLPDNRNENGFNPDSFPAELNIDWVRVYQCKDNKVARLSCMQDLD